MEYAAQISAQSPRLSEHLERLRLTLSLSFRAWCEVASVSPENYRAFLRGTKKLGEHALCEIAVYTGLSAEQLTSGDIHYQEVALRVIGDDPGFPERYQQGAHSRLRTAIPLLNYVEDRKGWRARLAMLRHCGMSEAHVWNPMHRVSILFASDLLKLLDHHGCGANEFRSIGAYSVATNWNSALAREYATVGRVPELYERGFGDLLQYYEENCDYRILSLTANSCTVEVRPKHEVEQALGVGRFGSPAMCATKAGVFSSGPAYLCLPFAEVREKACVHQGHEACVYEIDFSAADRVVKERGMEKVKAAMPRPSTPF